MNLLEEFKRKERYTPAENNILAYIEAHRDAIAELSIQELAEKTYTSNAAVVRLCRKLGLSGFREFKVRFAQDLEKQRLEERETDINYPFSQAEAPADIAAQLASLSISSIQTAYQNLDIKCLQEAAEKLFSARQIYLFGTGDSEIRGLSFSNKLAKIGKYPVNTSQFQELPTFCQFAQANDCALFITYSGSGFNYLPSARTLKQHGTYVILLTAHPDRALSQLADCILSFPDQENACDSIGSFYSQLSLEYLLNVLYSLIFALHYQENVRRKKDIFRPDTAPEKFAAK